MFARARQISTLAGAAFLVVISSTVGAVADRTITVDAASYNSDGYSVTTTTPPTLTTTRSAGDHTAIVFTSADSNVCTIDATTGVVTFVRGGQCEITAEVPVDSTYAAANDTISFPVFDHRTANRSYTTDIAFRPADATNTVLLSHSRPGPPLSSCTIKRK